MNGDDPLHAFFDDLRQPATASEMTGESNTIDAVTTALMSSKGTPMRFLSNSRRLRVASFVAAGIVGFGGVAAAGPAVYDTVTDSDWPKTEQPVEERDENVVETTVAPETTVPETTVATTVAPISVVATTDGEVDDVTTLVNDPETDFDETKCADGNHGQTVSSVAHETPSGPGKGQIVSEAAHSSCGKDDKADDETDEPEDEADEADTSGSPKNGKGNGNSNGSNDGGNNSNGGGNGSNGNGNGGGKHKDD